MSRRGATALRGIIPVDKPVGLTSHDVVARIRKATGEGRVGHAGTLDPAATGVLVVLLGPYTRLEPYLSSAVKRYDARIVFGAETDTDDAEGAVVRTADVPASCLDRGSANAALSALVGPSLQVPPAYSAIKVGGRVAHRAARSGAPLEVEARPIEVHAASLLGIDEDAGAWDVSFTVSKGTYIRALARDLGRACGSAAHLGGLRRTASGSVSIEDARPLDAIVAEIEAGRLAGVLLDPFSALGLPVVDVPLGTTRTGGALPGIPGGIAEGQIVALAEAGSLAALYRATVGALVPAVVFPEVPAA